MEVLALASILSFLLLAPHWLPQARIRPGAGIVLWAAVLSLRAVLSVCLALIAVLRLPGTDVFGLLTHWCVHAVLPFLAEHLGFDGHKLGAAAVLVPGLIAAASMVSVGFGLWRGARAVRRWLLRSSLGPGPRSSVIVSGSDIVVAVAGLRSPKVVVSAGALLRLDDAELAAGLEHEWGHVRRYHRFVVVGGAVCAALARLLPGTKRSVQALQFHLERDADVYAISRTGDRHALASAICKAAQGGHTASPILAGLAGSGAPERVRVLIRETGTSESALGTSVALFLTTLTVGAAFALVAASPSLGAAESRFGGAAPAEQSIICE